MSHTITCPSGLAGRIRGLKTREERILADRKLARDGTQLDQLLAACWEETLDAGPYDFGGAVDWGKVLQGDRFFALLQIRCASYGADYAFTIPCESRACRARIAWEVDLRELPIRPLSPDSRARFVAGNRLDTVLGATGRRVTFRLPTGADERRMGQLRQSMGDRPLSTVLACRVEAIEGVEPRDRQAFIEDLPMSEVMGLLAEMDRVDCGVVTSLEVECPECLAVQGVELPFDRGFFLPATPTRSPQGPGSSSHR